MTDNMYKCRCCGHIMSKVMKLEDWKSLNECIVTYTYVCTPCKESNLMIIKGFKS